MRAWAVLFGCFVSSTQVYESLITEVASLDRAALTERLAHFPGIRLDFSPDYLDRCSTDQLRHILLAATWHCRMKEQAR